MTNLFTLALQLDSATSRNAALVVRLRKTIAQLHLRADGHDRMLRWWMCAHRDCRAAAELLEIGPRDAAVGERRDHDNLVERGVARADRPILGGRS